MDSINKKTIFLVDDDVTNLVVGKKALVKQYTVFALNSGQILLDTLEKVHPDLILLDINMPEMTGIETLQKIRENPKTAHLPVIFLTSLDDNDTVMVALHYGVNDYITKPFVPDDLLIRVESHLKNL